MPTTHAAWWEDHRNIHFLLEYLNGPENDTDTTLTLSLALDIVETPWRWTPEYEHALLAYEQHTQGIFELVEVLEAEDEVEETEDEEYLPSPRLAGHKDLQAIFDQEVENVRWADDAPFSEQPWDLPAVDEDVNRGDR